MPTCVPQVSIKLDKEERPDIDKVYMSFVQATTGRGGWPMSVFLTPELTPIYGGTYFPPPTFLRLLQKINDAWTDDRETIVKQGAVILKQMERMSQVDENVSDAEAERVIGAAAALLNAGVVQFSRQFDADLGGFGGAPKFPRPVILSFLMAMARRRADLDAVLEMVVGTLDAMAQGGLYDHVDGGFHRYSVDEFWHIPHFEKMSYDNSQLALAYLEARPLVDDERKGIYERIVRETLDYVLRTTTHADGGFFCGEDADSYPEDDPSFSHKREGSFTLFSYQVLEEVLGEAEEEHLLAVVAEMYGAEHAGNIREDSDPHGEMTGLNHLFFAKSAEQVAESTGLSVDRVEALAARGLDLLRERRNARPRPHLDDKVLAGWSGLMISAMAQAGGALAEPRYVAAARKAADFVWTEMVLDGNALELRRVFRNGVGTTPGFLTDYAYLIGGLIDVHAVTGDAAALQRALALQEAQIELFWDSEKGGWFEARDGDATLPLRQKGDQDMAEPSGASVAARNLFRLGHTTGNELYLQLARESVVSMSSMIEQAPSAVPLMLVTLEALDRPHDQLVLVGDDDGALRQAAIAAQRPMLAIVDEACGHADFASYTRVDGRPTAYLCSGGACQAPVTDVDALRKLF